MSEYFFEQLKDILGGEYSAFKAAYDGKPRHKALRVNTGKISKADFVALIDKYERAGVREYGLKQSPLCEEAFYTSVKPSADPLYHAGLYYMQEPSASAAVSAFLPYIGERVLDLCAAPGGKSTQAAAHMKGGVIFCNDVEIKRVRVLYENIARLGVKNAVVTCSTAAGYVKAGLTGYFDTLIVDAPCSGGGMMRYENVPYTKEIVEGCAARQREIIDDAVRLLRTGGYMLYSTCTFSPQEDEDIVRYIIGKGFEPVDTPLLPGLARGIDLPQAKRIYPHNFDGEGHFFCVLKKTAEEYCDVMPEKRVKLRRADIGGLTLTAADTGDELIVRDFELPFITDKAARMIYAVGVPVFGRGGGKTHEYSHALSHALGSSEISVVGCVELGDDASRYIRGEQLALKAPCGRLIATVDGYALGWVKCADDGAGETVLKNLYPKGFRI